MTISRREFAMRAAGVSAAVRAIAGTEPVAIDLVAARSSVALDGRTVELLTYNGGVPGPLITIRPGQEVLIRLTNLLPEPTNLHFHGLHLPPNPGVDDSFLMIPPGEQHEFRFTLPPNHPAGTFWYHPHVHGRTAEQVSGGLAGPILVRSELEDGLGLSRLPEQVLLLQDFDVTAAGTLARPAAMDLMAGREGSLVLASGLTRPDLPILAGGFLRLRVINASSSRFYNLRVDEHPFLLIGTDGGLIRSPQQLDSILLSPGERVDALVQGNRAPGTYRLWTLPYNRGAGMGAMIPSSGRPIELARINYESGEPDAWQPPALLEHIEPLPGPRLLRRFVLGQAMGRGMMGGAMSFTINGRRFDMDRVDTRVRLGDVEDWEFLNSTSMDHPMHIHTNAFQLVGSDGAVEPVWKDTVLVKAGRTVRVRTRFEDFRGLSVYHCHILDHEDMGMMGTLEID